jgi:hypothetical protein
MLFATSRGDSFEEETMYSKSLLYKVLVLTFAALTLNQLACNNASFEADQGNRAQRAPAPDNIDNPFADFDDSDAVRCDNTDAVFCDRGDDGLTDEVPPLNYNPPHCDITRTGDCFVNYYEDTRRNPINGVDVWLVVDSSRSFDAARVAVGRALADGFIRDLSRNVPVRISVIAGHAPSGSYAGVRSAAPAINPEVFYRHSNEPLTVTINSPAEINSKRSQLLSKLNEFMRESPISIAKRNRGGVEVFNNYFVTWPLNGPHSGSDELGLRNFYDAIAGPNRAQIPRDNGWVVLFLSDENDACVPFTSYSERSAHNVGGFYYSHRSDEAEMKDWYCSGISPSRVYAEAVRFAGDRPYAIGGMLYRDRRTIPGSAHPQADIGRGYLEVIARAGRQGATVDLATATSSWGLESTARRIVSELANITNESVGTHTQYPIYDDRNNRLSLNAVETIGGRFNMQVYVDGQRSNYTIDSRNSLVRPSTLGRNVEIHFCLDY